MLEYQRADSRQTLQEGLSEYYASREGLAGGRGISPAAREFFRCHDAAHVVFGCSTALEEEAIVKLWSFFGTTAGLGLLRAYRLPESQEIYEQLTFSEIARTSFRSMLTVPLVRWRCHRMRKRWPWSEFTEFMTMPLVDVRRTFGIQVLSRERAARPRPMLT